MKPFDLEAAKRGDPIMTRDGRPVKFIAHVPYAREGDRVVMLFEDVVLWLGKSGHFYLSKEPHHYDLFMAPRKRTVWVNVYPMTEGRSCYWYNTEKAANESAGTLRIGNRAWPLEIEE